MTLRPFDFADLPRDHAALLALTDTPESRERLRDRIARGPAPSCAAAVLAAWGDVPAILALSPLAPFLDRPEIESLASSALAHEALACVVASSATPASARQAALEVISRIPVTPECLAVILELAERERDPMARAARAVGTLLLGRADKPTRVEAERQRSRVALVRSWTGIRRQELQREAATGSLSGCTMVLAGDPSFLAGLVPPIADEARRGLVPAVLAAARGADDAVRSRLFALFQGRFREVARDPLSMLARFESLKGRDARVPLLALERLVAFGAWRDVLSALVYGAADVRAAALAALQRAPARALAELDPALVDSAVHRLAHGVDPTASEKLRAAFARA